MEIELIEIRDFLAQRHPFDALSEERLKQLPESLQIRYLRRGSAFPPADADGDYLYIVRSGAIELRDEKGKLYAKLAEGDYYTSPCQLVDYNLTTHNLAVEDSLLYLLSCADLKTLQLESEEFDLHFKNSIRERLRRAASGDTRESGDGMAHMAVEVADLGRKPPVTMEANRSIREAARLMTEQNVSSVMLLESGKLAGMITDSDLRKRCVAVGLSVERPAGSIMTSNLETIKHDDLALEAMMTMTRLHVHHLPVMKEGEIFGMLTATDITRHNSRNPAFIVTDIGKAHDLQQLIDICRRLPALQLQLANSSATALHIGEAVSLITDAVTNRLIEMAQEELGPEPVPFVWVCGGSQARGEQTSHSDQDNALIIADEYAEDHHPYFEALANRVCGGLDACGFVYCPGDAMASNPEWRQPIHVWRRYFNNWITKPEPKALMLASIFFDLRPVYGDQKLYKRLQLEILNKTRGNGIFTAYMAANALTHRPPLGFFRTFVLIRDGEHNDTLDIKHRGIVPITDIARILSLSRGVNATNTTDRLRTAIKLGALSEEMGENLVDALEFIASLRISHQAGQIRRGEKPDNYLAPDDLSVLERKHLKDAFKVIEEMQDTMEHRYQLARFR
jgi:CBS domain-containing protein